MSSTTYNIVPGRYDRDLPISTKTHFISSAATTNATLVKGSAGSIFNIIVHNTDQGAGHAHHLRLYNLNRVPVVGTDVPMAIINIAAGSSKEMCFASGITFSNGIAYSITEEDELLDDTAVEADSVQLYIGYM